MNKQSYELFLAQYWNFVIAICFKNSQVVNSSVFVEMEQGFFMDFKYFMKSVAPYAVEKNDSKQKNT